MIKLFYNVMPEIPGFTAKYDVIPLGYYGAHQDIMRPHDAKEDEWKLNIHK